MIPPPLDVATRRSRKRRRRLSDKQTDDLS
jgi:hypothetical protein